MDRPIFEIRDGDKHYRIWANGRTEGFKAPIVVNRIQQYLQDRTPPYEVTLDEHRRLFACGAAQFNYPKP